MSIDSTSMIQRAVAMLTRPPHRPTGLTSEVHKAIVDRITVGAFPQVAAAANGVPKPTWMRWMKRGAAAYLQHEAAVEAGEPSEMDIYASLWVDVEQAKSKARQMAEGRVFRDDPLAWLVKGPGKSKPDDPGWSERTEVTGANGGALTVAASAIDIRNLNDEDLDALDAIAAKASRAPTDPG